MQSIPPTTRIAKSTCSYCGVGCGIEILTHRDGRMELRGDENHPANRGQLCTKGRTLLHTVLARDTRLHFPTMRLARDEPRTRVTWDQAINRVADEFRRIQSQHGPDSVAWYVSGQCLTEEYYLANKLAKGFLGTNNIDTNSRLCMSSAVCGYKATLGADAPPICYEDLDEADTFLIAGANPAWCHPILFRRIEARRQADPSARIICIDPRRTATAEMSDLHLPIKPGTDVALFLTIARRLRDTNHLDLDFIRDHVDGWDSFNASLDPWTLPHGASVTGIPESDIAAATDLLAGPRRFLSLWTMGLNQSAAGTDKNIALISLSLITGKIGRPGCGPFSLTGQPNAMGGREVGGMATLLPAHRDLANPAHRQFVADFWGVPSIPATPGLTAVELFESIRARRVKAVWIIATNPVASMPAAWRVEEALAAAEFVVSQDLFPTETTDLADVVLPAAGWLEKTGTMTNSDRRISLLEKAASPPGEARSDTEILLHFARQMGLGASFAYNSPAEIFAEHAALTAGTDIDISGLSHDLLRRLGPTQWPFPAEGRTPGPVRLYTDHHFATPSRRANLRALRYENRSEPLSDQFPLILTTGRIRDQWHTMTKTGLVSRLKSHTDSPFCEINPVDADSRGINPGDIVTVASTRGSVQVRAVITADIRPGVVFLPMHFGKKLAGEKGRANNLTSPRLDPISREPDLKFAAVEVARYTAPTRRIVIVGGGTACLAFVEAHRRNNTHDAITVLSAEPEPIYNRVLLPHYIDGSRSFESLIRADADTFARHRVTYRRNTAIVRIDRENRLVKDTAGETYPYDTLVLATGSRPAVHYDGPLPDTGTHTLRSRADADRILAAAKEARHIVITGGGLLGLELAGALKSLPGSREITILQRSDRLMSKQLDAVAGAHLADELADRGIHVRFRQQLASVIGDPLECILLQSGEIVSCDLLVFATGTIPNKELAGAAGIDCNRGVLVDAFLRTSDPSIFAIGECAEFNGETCGTTPAAEAQARALAEFLRGNEHAPYKGTIAANILKLHGLQLGSAGLIDPPAGGGYEIIALHDTHRRYYQKLVIDRDRLVGALCMGDLSRFAEYLDLISTGLELENLRDSLLRPGAPQAPAEGPVVCSCFNVGCTTVQRAAAAPDASLGSVCSATRAGTGCGSCRPEIARIIDRARAASRPPSAPVDLTLTAQTASAVAP